MDEARINRAMNRAASALSRIERALERLPLASEGSKRQDALRQQVTATLGDLDQLIAELER